MDIVATLPDYFTDDVVDAVRVDLAAHAAWIVLDADGGAIGFVVVDRRSRQAAEVLWIAVRPRWRGRGAGTALLNRALADLGDDGVRIVEAKTLDPAAGHQPYRATHAFWDRRGFVHIDAIEPFPGWQPGNPAAIYVAALAPTR